MKRQVKRPLRAPVAQEKTELQGAPAALGKAEPESKDAPVPNNTVRVRVRARVKRGRFPITWGLVDFLGEPETEFDAPLEALSILKAGGWIVGPTVLPVEPTPTPVLMPPIPDRLLVNGEAGEPAKHDKPDKPDKPKEP